jgi:uncharacterized protein (DUF1015 family)
MSKIIPFSALIPTKELVDVTSAPPYDVIDTKAARKIAEGKPSSILHITRPEIDLDRAVDVYDDEVFSLAENNLKKFQSEGWLIRDKPSLYAYRLTRGDHTQLGLVCAAAVDDLDNGTIRKHEKTRENKEDERTQLAMELKTHLEPVLYVHRRSEQISKLMNDAAQGEPLFDITDGEGVRHTMWRITHTDKIVNAFASLKDLYIADGHHRSAAASRVRRKFRDENRNHSGDEAYNFFPVVIFPEDEVRVYRYDWDGPTDERPLADFTMSDIMDISDRNEVMPPKSTWFAPKLASGLFIYTFY